MIRSRAPFNILPVSVGIGMIVLSACAGSPPARFYTLHPVTYQNTTGCVAGMHNKIIAVAPIDIPDYLDRPQIVTRTSQNQLSLAEFDLWGGSLKADIHRVLREDLSKLLATDGYSIVDWRPGVPMDYRMTLHVTRFDAKPGEAVLLAAQWSLSAREGKANVLDENFNLTEPIPANDCAAVVAAMSRALGTLSVEMAERIRSLP